LKEATFAVLLLLLAPSLQAAHEDKYFRRAIQALDRKEFTAAEHELRTVLQINGQESRRKIAITSNRFEWYLPHYFLGLALLSQGDREGAYAEWTESREQAVIFAWRDYQRFDQAWSSLDGLMPARRTGSDPRPPVAPPPPRPSPVAELEGVLGDAGKALAEAGPPNLRSIEIFVKVGDAMSVARVELGRNQPRAAELGVRTKALRQALAELDKRPADRRSGDELADDLLRLSNQARSELAGSSSSQELTEALEKINLELRKNLPSREVLVRNEATLLRALYPQAFP
jgi:hypothetical protein